MSFNFEIENKLIIQKKSLNKEDLFCSFVFHTPEWKHLDKYAIFWNKEGKSSISYIGPKQKGQCPIPQMVLDDLFFYIQVYANDNILTNKLKIFTVDQKRPKHHCKEKREFDVKQEDKIDNVVYEDNKLLFYANNKLVQTIDIIDEQLLQKVLANTAPEYIVDTVLSSTSNHPLANKTIYRLLQKKMDLNSLSSIAYTGSYNDLKDVPEEFPPMSHNHTTNDITDFDEAIDGNINLKVDVNMDDLIEAMIEELEKEN